MQRALDELGVRTWIAGLRRDQARTRTGIDFLELRDGRWKLHPIADWTDRDVWNYLQRHGLPYHPLWDQGYVSIGDVHTTRPLQAGMEIEETRFFGLKRECGLHFDDEPGIAA
jgi:phosphoadenosine phosphosulfate reductase